MVLLNLTASNHWCAALITKRAIWHRLTLAQLCGYHLHSGFVSGYAIVIALSNRLYVTIVRSIQY